MQQNISTGQIRMSSNEQMGESLAKFTRIFLIFTLVLDLGSLSALSAGQQQDCQNCSNCTNCKNCNNCSNCTNCTNCSNCSNCHDCHNCRGCSDMRQCRDCSICSNMQRCSNCTDCSNCSDAHNCSRQSDTHNTDCGQVGGAQKQSHQLLDGTGQYSDGELTPVRRFFNNPILNEMSRRISRLIHGRGGGGDQLDGATNSTSATNHQ